VAHIRDMKAVAVSPSRALEYEDIVAWWCNARCCRKLSGPVSAEIARFSYLGCLAADHESTHDGRKEFINVQHVMQGPRWCRHLEV